ncbi:hypothetical protein ACFSTE_18325 [Aquimarina hainanensis]|uniref:DUF4398 domain-containing protein n=1 Tax=Aquimarina hainanensis TaxID=1578017 RepID=A0ABW5NEG3_9FLAO|nr:hypothetical protein [Aquimarina sp. TRL1]QKX06710.1 hypothetical protein HN014_17905 [Aquimarina sp. TRL1]
MKKIKSFGAIGLIAMAFIFMSFSNGGDDLYGSADTITYVSADDQNPEQAAILAAALRFTARATRRAIVYTREVARVQLPGIEQVIMQASTYIMFAYDNVNDHKNNYVKDLKVFKKQKIHSLG